MLLFYRLNIPSYNAKKGSKVVVKGVNEFVHLEIEGKVIN